MDRLHIPPERMLAELAETARKLGQGMQNLLHVRDIPTGVTPKEAVYREDKMTLYRFHSGARAPDLAPLLIVYAMVNRPYMADLQEDRSLIRGLLNAGLDVYLIDWGYPDRSDRYLDLDDYVDGYIDRCVELLHERHGIERVNLLGICQGGTLSLCYAALHPHKVRTLITMVTPVDFQTSGDMLARWVRHLDVDAAVDAFGNIPGELLNWAFLMLKPHRLMGQKYLDMVARLDQPAELQNFLRTEKWIFDSPDQAGEAFRRFIKELYQENRLIKGTLRIGGRAVSLANLTMPVLNIYARADHLVPPAASLALRHHVGTRDYRELAFRGGHIGIYISGRSQKEVPPAISGWLRERAGSGRSGSATPVRGRKGTRARRRSGLRS